MSGRTVTYQVEGVDNIAIGENHNLFGGFTVGGFFRQARRSDVYVKISKKRAFNLDKSRQEAVEENMKIYPVDGFTVDRTYED